MTSNAAGIGPENLFLSSRRLRIVLFNNAKPSEMVPMSIFPVTLNVTIAGRVNNSVGIVPENMLFPTA